MKRKKQPTPQIKEKKKRFEKLIEKITTDWNADERETSILFDHQDKVVYLETSYPSTARRWFKNLWGDPKVVFDEHADSLKIQVPWEYCRKPDLIMKHKHRTHNG